MWDSPPKQNTQTKTSPMFLSRHSRRATGTKAIRDPTGEYLSYFPLSFNFPPRGISNYVAPALDGGAALAQACKWYAHHPAPFLHSDLLVYSYIPHMALWPLAPRPTSVACQEHVTL